MFNSSNKSKNPIGFIADTLFDAFLPKNQKPKHRVRNGLIVTSLAVGSAAAAAALAKKGGDA